MGMHTQPLWLDNFHFQCTVFIGFDLLIEHPGAWSPPFHRAKTPSATTFSSQPMNNNVCDDDHVIIIIWYLANVFPRSTESTL